MWSGVDGLRGLWDCLRHRKSRISKYALVLPKAGSAKSLWKLKRSRLSVFRLWDLRACTNPHQGKRDELPRTKGSSWRRHKTLPHAAPSCTMSPCGREEKEWEWAARLSGRQLGRNAVTPHVSDQDRWAQGGPNSHSWEPSSFPDIPVSEAPSAWLYSCLWKLQRSLLKVKTAEIQKV